MTGAITRRTALRRRIRKLNSLATNFWLASGPLVHRRLLLYLTCPVGGWSITSDYLTVWVTSVDPEKYLFCAAILSNINFEKLAALFV